MIFPKINAFPLYWENGMKLSASHFQHLENSVEDAIRDSRAIGLTANQGFGLLPYSPFSLQNAQGEKPQSVRVVLNACRAVLPGGYRVEILPDNVQHLQVPSKSPFVEFVPAPGVRYHLFLSVNESRRISTGVPQVRPIRYPYLAPEYHLEHLAHEKLSVAQRLTPNRMKIAEWQDGKIIEGYIPPVLVIKGYPMLEKWYESLQTQIDKMALISVQVINEHRTKDLARVAFCLPIVQYIRSTQGYYKWVLPNQSPLNLAGYFGDLAGLTEALIETCDRDFVRNQLKEGNDNNLLKCIRDLRNYKAVPLEEMAGMLMLIRKFVEALVLTLQNLQTAKDIDIRQGDRNIGSG